MFRNVCVCMVQRDNHCLMTTQRLMNRGGWDVVDQVIAIVVAAVHHHHSAATVPPIINKLNYLPLNCEPGCC